MSHLKRHPQYLKLHLFKAPNGRSKNWYCGFYNAGRFIRVSTQTPSWSDALVAAENWYLERQYEIRHGLAAINPTKNFAALATSMIDRMEKAGRSIAYIRVLRNYLRARGYVINYFGKMLPKQITTRTWDDFRLWLSQERRAASRPQLSERSIHQLKNAVRLVLRQAYVERLIDDIPRFIDPLRAPNRDHRPRVFFSPTEYEQLVDASRRNIITHSARKTRWLDEAQELHDYIVFMINTGLRVSECHSLSICDVSLVGDICIEGLDGLHEVCEITITDGKRGAHPPFLSRPGAAKAFRRILSRREIPRATICTEPLFAKHHREAFKRLLREEGLYFDRYHRKRDFVSLRHSHICFRLMSGEPLFYVARAVRTSPTMIDKHYAKALSARASDEASRVWLIS